MSNPISEDRHILANNILALFPEPRKRRQENDWQENWCSQSSRSSFAAKGCWNATRAFSDGH
jgi:hypothetical protein